MPSSSCSRARCKPRPKISISSWPRCCAIKSSSSGPTATPSAPPMRLSADALNRFGEALGRELAAPAVVGLSGELGTGKTTFVQAICRGLGARGLATSPTYALVHQYRDRSEEHTSELQSQSNLVCRLLLEKKNKIKH